MTGLRAGTVDFGSLAEYQRGITVACTPVMRRYFRPSLVTLVLLTAALGAACSSPTTPSSTASIADRIAGTWVLVSSQRPGESAVAPPASTFSLNVVDGRAGIRADCNQCNGSAAVGPSTLTVGPTVACTRAFCPTAPYDTQFVQVLSGESDASIDGSVLTLRSSRGVLRFSR
jgi:heat shock protein HslJ